MRCSSIKTALPYHLGFFVVVPCFTGSRIRNEEATGSIPVSSTNLLNNFSRLEHRFALGNRHFIGPVTDQRLWPARRHTPSASGLPSSGLPERTARRCPWWSRCASAASVPAPISGRLPLAVAGRTRRAQAPPVHYAEIQLLRCRSDEAFANVVGMHSPP